MPEIVVPIISWVGANAGAIAVAGAAVAGSAALQKEQADKAKADANKKAAAAAAANEQVYQDLTQNQMKLSLLTGQTQDIVNVINATNQPGPVYTLPSEATPTDPVTRINQAIGDLLKGG
jgi:hypothetical protein